MPAGGFSVFIDADCGLGSCRLFFALLSFEAG